MYNRLRPARDCPHSGGYQCRQSDCHCSNSYGTYLCLGEWGGGGEVERKAGVRTVGCGSIYVYVYSVYRHAFVCMYVIVYAIYVYIHTD